jgi:glyoxylase-like metal-dependent hydrolase (beta-lactamase superfamily II)
MVERTIELVNIEDLDRRVRVFRCGSLVDSFAVVTERLTVVVDTMINRETASQVWGLLDADSRSRPILIVNTHGDWDHAWGNGFFDGPLATAPAPIIGHSARRKQFDWNAERAFVDKMRSAEPGTYDSVEPRLPTVEVSERITINGGDCTLELVPTPGHTADHLAIWMPELSILIAGDAAEMPLPYVSARSDLAAMRHSLATMRDLRPSVVLYSHGGGYYVPEVISANIAYLDEAKVRCRQWVADHGGEAATPEDLDWPLDAVIPFGANLEPEQQEFYAAAHARVIGAMTNWIIGAT